MLADELLPILTTCLRQRWQDDTLAILSIERDPDTPNLNEKGLSPEFLKSKYSGHAYQHFLGFHPIRVTLQSQGQNKTIKIAIKGYQSQGFGGSVCPQALIASQLDHMNNYANSLVYREFCAMHLAAGCYYSQQLQHPLMANYMPDYIGRHTDKNHDYYYIFLSIIEQPQHLNELDSSTQWPDTLFDIAVDGISALHATFYQQTHVATLAPLPKRFTQTDWQTSDWLWQGMLEAMHRDNPNVLDDRAYTTHAALIQSMQDWQAPTDTMATTIIHADFGPRNFGFTKKNQTLQLCALDWECAREHLPQYDIALMLLYANTPDTVVARSLKYRDLARQRLMQHSQQHIDTADWNFGFRACVIEQLINRAPLLALIFNIYPAEHNLGTWLYRNAIQLLPAL